MNILTTTLLSLAIAASSGPVLAKHTNKHFKNQVRAIVNQEITKRMPSTQGPQGHQGPQGLQGPQGPPGAELRYAHVTSAGVVDAARSVGVSQGNLSSTPGVHCFNGLATTRGGQATVDITDGDATNAYVTVGYSVGSTTCQVLVALTDSSGALIDGGFYLLLY